MKISRKKRLIIIALAVVLGFGLCSAAAIVWDGLSDRIEPVDVAIVLGSSVENGHPLPRLRARLNKAVELYRAHDFDNVIVSGGIDPNHQNEAEIMKAYLVEKGLPADHIFADPGGSNTWHTGENARVIMRKHQMRTAMAISQYFHITRTKLALRHFNIDCTAWAHANYYEPHDILSIGREVVGFYVYGIRAIFSGGGVKPHGETHVEITNRGNRLTVCLFNFDDLVMLSACRLAQCSIAFADLVDSHLGLSSQV